MQPEPEPTRFLETARATLADPHLQQALDASTRRLSLARQAAKVEVPDWEALRTRAYQIKKHTLENLPRYLTELETRVREHGGQVFWATDAAAACDYIASLAARTGARLIVKSKSMTTEEIDLVTALARHGIETVETDLGEFIIQLAHERPYHIVAPAVHKTREDVGELFVRALGAKREREIGALTQIARQALREKFARADLGISGANFAVAETGTVVVVENEGNARLSMSLPRVHVVVLGIEKVIPGWAELEVFLRLLARSATGQKLTSYTSFITGPRHPGEPDGPEEFHLLLLDNGRSRILADPIQRSLLFCIRCGACLNVCPVYRKVGGHSYGWVYSGPIGAILNPELLGWRMAAELPFASSLCAACAEVCPVKIPLPELLLNLRAKATACREAALRPHFKQKARIIRAWAVAMKTAWGYVLAGRVARWWLRRRSEHGWVRALPGLLAGWTHSRDIPLPAAKTFRELWKDGRV